MSFLQKYACILVLLMSVSLSSIAQQNRFVYLQTDNRQPFYVKMNKLVYSSSATGYLIIPKLTDNTYEMSIGFPKNEFPEQQLNLKVDGKDAGYVVKNFGEKGWGLFNLQTLAVVMATAKPGTPEAGKPQSSEDEFSRVLAGVVNSPDIAQKKPSPPPGEKTVVAPVSQKDENQNTSGIIKLQDKRSDSGREMVYVDGVDTIAVFIPVTATSNSAAEEKKPVVSDVPVEKKADPGPVIQNKATDPSVKEKASVHITNCSRHANDNDFLKLRKKMASRTNDFDMISDAMKSFKTRCYSTEQLRNLSALFLSNQGKYSFFDASYNFVSDPEHFVSLREILTDEYFQQRFDAMIRK